MVVTIHQATVNDWQAYKTVRLKALHTDPQFFGSNHALESTYTEVDWREHLENPNTAVFLLYDQNAVIGMTGAAADRNVSDTTQAYLWGSWLEPSYRGRGLSKLMYEERLAWCRAHPTINRIVVSHRASNLASKGANQKHGFVYTESIRKTWPDGVTEDEVFYVLALDKPLVQKPKMK